MTNIKPTINPTINGDISNNMNNNKKRIAYVIGNGGLGDMMACIGIVNYLATQYAYVFVASMHKQSQSAIYFYDKKNIIVYDIEILNTQMAEFDRIMRKIRLSDYDVYAFGHYGCDYVDYKKFVKYTSDKQLKPILWEYPLSYYDDLGLPREYMKKYFTVSYSDDILAIYDDLLKHYQPYTVIQQDCSGGRFDIINYRNYDINKKLVIDVNKNLYQEGHKFYDIAQKFINLRVIPQYVKLIENASELYFVDSCVFTLSCVCDLSKPFPKVCYHREQRTKFCMCEYEYIRIGATANIVS